MTLGEKIRQARQDKRMTQKELASQIGKSFSSVQKYEMDLATPPVTVIEKIAEVLEVNSFYFLKESKFGLAALKPPPRSFAERLRIIRMDRQYTQEQLAQYTDLSVNSIRLYESGKQTPSPNALRQLSQALECEEEELTNPECPIGFTSTYNINALLYSACVSSDERKLLDVFKQLNQSGQQRAIERVEELAEIPKYQRTAPPAPAEAVPTPPEGKDQGGGENA